MSESARELGDSLPPDCDNVTVSCDGTWQRRGFSSKNGVATVMSVNPNDPAKVADVDASPRRNMMMNNMQPGVPSRNMHV